MNKQVYCILQEMAANTLCSTETKQTTYKKTYRTTLAAKSIASITKLNDYISSQHKSVKSTVENKGKGKGKGIAVCETSPHRYGKSLTIWDHTVLPATRQR